MSVGVDHAEHPLALVDVAKGRRRREDRLLDVITHSRKLFSKLPKMSACKPLAHILEPSHGGTTLVKDPGEVDEGSVAVAVRTVVFRAEPIPGA
jgi:hypothetical protein